MNNISWGIFSFFAGELASVILALLFKKEKVRNRILVIGTILSGILALGLHGQELATQSFPPITTTSSSPSSISTQTKKPTVVEIIDKGVPMVLIPASEFIMGSDNENERPAHTVYLDAYYIDKYEITNAAYKTCVEAGVCKNTETYSPQNTIYLDDVVYQDYPVMAVDWNSARVYCNWRSARLPTEAEWEKAARGTDGRIYPWGNEINNARANYNSYVGDITQVGNYESGKSIYGVYDMAGNVWEWVNSLYQDYPYDAFDGREELNPSGVHVLRGGAFNQPEDFVRSSYRFPLAPPDFLLYSGFRCAKDA